MHVKPQVEVEGKDAVKGRRDSTLGAIMPGLPAVGEDLVDLMHPLHLASVIHCMLEENKESNCRVVQLQCAVPLRGI